MTQKIAVTIFSLAFISAAAMQASDTSSTASTPSEVTSAPMSTSSSSVTSKKEFLPAPKEVIEKWKQNDQRALNIIAQLKTDLEKEKHRIEQLETEIDDEKSDAIHHDKNIGALLKTLKNARKKTAHKSKKETTNTPSTRKRTT